MLLNYLYFAETLVFKWSVFLHIVKCIYPNLKLWKNVHWALKMSSEHWDSDSKPDLPSACYKFHLCHQCNTSNKTWNPILLIRRLITAREVSMPWHRSEEEEKSQQVTSFRSTIWHTWERFWTGGFEQLCQALVTHALLRIGEACFKNTWLWSGAGPWLWETIVGSNTDISLRRPSERSGHHHESALGWGLCASLPLDVPVLWCLAGCGGWT